MGPGRGRLLFLLYPVNLMQDVQNGPPDPLSQALARDYQSPDWAAAVLRVLGNHIRWLEDRTRELQYANDSHEAFRNFDREQITALKNEIESKLEGSITEQLALDNNALIEHCRQWTSWAGQANAFRRHAMMLLTDVDDGTVKFDAVHQFRRRVEAGDYDIIPLPGGTIPVEEEKQHGRTESTAVAAEPEHPGGTGEGPGAAAAAVAAAEGPPATSCPRGLS